MFAVLLTTMIGCSVPRNHQLGTGEYRSSSMRGHQLNKKVDCQMPTKENWARKRSGKRGEAE
jgi:hypothetical protein